MSEGIHPIPPAPGGGGGLSSLDPFTLFTVDESGKELRVSRSTVYRLIREKRIGTTPVTDGSIRITARQILDFLESCRVDPQTPEAPASNGATHLTRRRRTSRTTPAPPAGES